MARPEAGYVVDPLAPQAPPQDVWDRLTQDERRAVLGSLPSEIPLAGPPEGDRHSNPKYRARGTLEEHFRRLGRRIYIGSELPVYYPGERMFAPDLIAVLDVEPHERDHWTVSHEGRGLDLCIEIHVRGSEAKDFVENVTLYGRLGIPEYFAFSPARGRLQGWRLVPGARAYQPIVPQEGRWRSQLLGLDLAVDERRLRFFYGAAPLLETSELIVRLGAMLDAATQRAEEEGRRAEDEARRAEGESRRAEDEARRAEDAAERARRYRDKLRELGVDPDTIV